MITGTPCLEWIGSMQGGADDFPSATIHTLSGLYKANITCVSHSPGKDLVFTGTGAFSCLFTLVEDGRIGQSLRFSLVCF